METTQERIRLPKWLRRPFPTRTTEKTHAILDKHKLNTVCESAICPNRSECYSNRTATFMILGEICTRSCTFCAIKVGKGTEVESDEPMRVAQAAADMGLQYVVITSVARDDLADEGAEHFKQTIEQVKLKLPHAKVEVLTPDFHAREELIRTVLDGRPDVFNHNMETVKRLQKPVRVQGQYDRTLKVLETVKRLEPQVLTKSGLMLGLGEEYDEIIQTGKDLRAIGCDILTLGQYLAPTKEHFPLVRYVSPEEFKQLENDLKALGFKEVFAGPYVRSSYHAGETFHQIKN